MSVCVNTSTVENPDGRKKQPFSKEEENIRLKAADYIAKLKEANADAFGNATKQGAADAARMSVEAEAKISQQLGAVIKLDPLQTDRIASFNARMFGEKDDLVKSTLLGTTEYTTPGDIRSAMLESKRVAHGALDEVGLLEKTGRIADLVDAIKRETTLQSISKESVNDVIRETIEVGRTGQDLAVYGNTPGMQSIANWRYNKYMDFMKQQGFSETSINNIINLSAPVASAGDEMRAIAMSQGVDVPKLQGMGYLARVPTDDFAKFMRARIEPSLLEEVRQGKVTLSGAFAKARTTVWYAPVNEDLGAMFLGTTRENLNTLLKDPVKFRNYIDANLTVKQLDDLVDTGIFKQLPMTGTEAFNYIVDQNQLPFKNINEMWKTDPYEAMAAMATNMKKSVGNAAIIKTALKDAMDAGWAIPSTLATAEHSTWVSTKGINLDRYGINLNETPYKEDLLVHPEVAAQMQSLLDVASSPAQMGTVMGYVQGVYNNLHKVRVASTAPAYLTKILFQNAISLGTAEGNIARLLPSHFDMLRVGNKGLEAFDNIKVLGTIDGAEVTQQSALKKLLLFRGEDIAPESTGIAAGRVNWETFNPLNSRRALTNMISYAKAYGTDPLGVVIKGADYAGYLAGKMLNNVYAGVAVPARMSDMAARWALLQSKLASGADVSWQEITRTMDNKFYMYDDLGQVNKELARYAFPFSSWTLKNLPAMARFALKDPQKFIAYNRLLQTINYQNQGKGKDAPIEAMYPQGFDENYPITLSNDPISGHQAMLMPNGYDPITDAFANIVSSGNAADRIFFGHYNGDSKEQTTLATKGQIGSAQEYMAGLIGRSYYAPAFAGMGIDVKNERYNKPDSGFDSHTFAGHPMSGVVKAVLMSVPPLKILENSGILGTPESKYYQLQNQQPAWMRVASTFGVTIQTVDTLQNIGYNYKDMVSAKGEMFKALKDYSLQNVGKKTSDMSPSDVSRYQHYSDAFVQLSMDINRLDAYKKAHNLTTPDLQNRLDNKVTRAEVLSGAKSMPGGDILTNAIQQKGGN